MPLYEKSGVEEKTKQDISLFLFHYSMKDKYTLVQAYVISYQLYEKKPKTKQNKNITCIQRK